MATASKRARLVWRAVGRLWRRSATAAGGLAENLLFPPRCAFCDVDLAEVRGDVLFCETCRRLLSPPAWSGCRRCGSASPEELPSPATCGWCDSMRLRIDATVVLGAYRDELREAVLRLKRASGAPLAAALARLFWRSRREALRRFRADLVVPVPMYWTRRLTRGINNPDILADELADRLRVPLAGRVLYRCRNTLPQADLSPRKRFRNVRGAFALRAGYDLQGTRVLLADDILTTGATSSEAADVLKKAGAAAVAVAVLARAGRGR